MYIYTCTYAQVVKYIVHGYCYMYIVHVHTCMCTLLPVSRGILTPICLTTLRDESWPYCTQRVRHDRAIAPTPPPPPPPPPHTHTFNTQVAAPPKKKHRSTYSISSAHLTSTPIAGRHCCHVKMDCTCALNRIQHPTLSARAAVSR